MVRRGRLLSAFVLGAWMAGTLFMWSLATQNFRLVDRLLTPPTEEVSRRTAPLAPGDARLLMRYQASESNRLFFMRWGWTQLGLAMVFAWLSFRWTADRRLKIAALVMLAIAVGLQAAVVPETVRLGRLLDFAARQPAPPEAAPFWRLHHAYTALDAGKLLLALFAATRLIKLARD